MGSGGGNSDSSVALSGNMSANAMKAVARQLSDQNQMEHPFGGEQAGGVSGDMSEEYLQASQKQSEIDRIRKMIEALGSSGEGGGYV